MFSFLSVLFRDTLKTEKHDPADQVLTVVLPWTQRFKQVLSIEAVVQKNVVSHWIKKYKPLNKSGDKRTFHSPSNRKFTPFLIYLSNWTWWPERRINLIRRNSNFHHHCDSFFFRFHFHRFYSTKFGNLIKFISGYLMYHSLFNILLF